jgi:hypothetical protein
MIRIVLILCLLIYSSCKKSDLNGHFHGRITYECNGSAVKGLRVYIVWVDLHDDRHTLKEGRTDNSGYYSINDVITHPGSLDYFELVTTGDIDSPPFYFISNRGWTKNFSAKNDQEDFQIDLAIPSNSYISFHIKNNNPFDDNDLFNLKPADMNGYYAWHWQGDSIDSVLNITVPPVDTYFYEYSFTKNGIENTVQDSLTGLCNDSSFVNIFY